MSHQPLKVLKLHRAIFTALFLFMCLFGWSNASENNHSSSREKVNQGKRYFMGLLPKASDAPSCVSCHYMRTADTINWNPAAMEIAILYRNKSVEELADVLKNPTGKVMTPAHADMQVPDEEMTSVKAYLDNLADNGLPVEKPSLLRMLLFLGLGVILTWALIDLIFLHKVKFKPIPILIVLAALGYQSKMVYEEAIKLGRSKNYQPDQPIKFSHAVHAGQNQIDCFYCHHTADKSKSANIPSTELCMNCHIVVREGTLSGKFEIAKLVKAYEEKKPVEWIRIHKLPDHVFFSHAQHVGAGKQDCAKCHGQVDQMDIMKQENDLSMGWCLDCHRQTKVQFQENGYYAKEFERFHKEIAEGKRDSVTAADQGANECMKCHY